MVDNLPEEEYVLQEVDINIFLNSKKVPGFLCEESPNYYSGKLVVDDVVPDLFEWRSQLFTPKLIKEDS